MRDRACVDFFYIRRLDRPHRIALPIKEVDGALAGGTDQERLIQHTDSSLSFTTILRKLRKILYLAMRGFSRTVSSPAVNTRS